MPYTLPAADAVARAQGTSLDFYAGLRPVIIGPRAGLHRFAVATEKTAIALGAYDPTVDESYAYPGKATGSAVDLTYVKLYADDADLLYFTKLIGVSGTCQPSSTYPNRVRASAYVFKTANDVDRSADFYDRDVTVGDVVQLRRSGTTFETSVTGFLGETVAAVTSAATTDANNPATQTLSASVTQIIGTPVNDVVATVDASGYDSLADGYINRTYTVTVTQASTGGDATTARLSVVSADGLDDDADVTPAAFGAATAIGTKGLEVTFAIDTSHSSAASYGIDEDDFVAGQQWTVVVAQAFTKPVPTSAGTYTGTRDTTYIVTVTRGGLYTGTDPQITVTTTNGADSSGPTDVTAAATATAVGQYGVTVAFSGTALRKGDVYYIPVTAATEGAVRTLLLKDSAPSAMLGQEVDLRLFVRRDGLLIPRTRALPSPATNWARDEDGIDVEAGIYIIDSEFTDGDDPVPLPLYAGTLYAEYREWLTTGEGTVYKVATPEDAVTNFGAADPDNPIGYGVYMALQNTAGQLLDDPLDAAATTTDVVVGVNLGGDPTDTTLWTTALELVEDDDEAYQIVPLSTLDAVHDLVVAHVTAQSADAVGFYRAAWLPATLNETAAIVSEDTTDDGEAATATIAADPDATPTAYTIVTGSSNSEFVDKGVRAGDTLRINYGTDDYGDETYDEYEVEAVISNTTLRLVTGPSAAIGVARMFEVWRAYTGNEMVAQLTALAATRDSDRVSLVWPDAVGIGGETISGYYGCCALAGLAGSVASHQALRNVRVAGIDDATRTSRFFTAAQVNDLRAGGVAVITQTPAGEVYVASDSTTDPTGVATINRMIRHHADMLRKAVQTEFAPYVGSGNTVGNLQTLLDAALYALVLRLKGSNFVVELGTPVGAMTISAVTVAAGSDVATVDIAVSGLPVPLNQIRVSIPVTLG